ncbi:MAG: peptidylprolyl isomerase [bacterium]|nr:peptidylprolyl isomerase [bacterium]
MKQFAAAWMLVMSLGVSLPAAEPERQTLDRIIAIVGKEAILASELAGQMQMITLQTGRKPNTEAEMIALRDRLLDEMVTDQLFLQEARKDTSISVRSEEIDQALAEHMQRVIGRMGSEEQFNEALAAEGMTRRTLEKRYRPDIEKQLLKQRLIQKRLMTVSISKHEVEEFYTKFKDSLPTQPEAVRLAHILLRVVPSERVEDSVKALATKLRQRIVGGADFATISSQYSSMGAGVNGGDIGYIAREDVDPEFARAAFALGVNEISGVIRTNYGYHIIRNEGKQENRLKLRHVLLAVEPSAGDTTMIFQLADSLLRESRGGASFEELAKTFSDDNNSRATGGELGWFSVNEMPAAFADAVAGWSEVGTFKGPIVSQDGIHLFKLLEYTAPKTFTIETDYDQIKELARQDKTGRSVDKWLADIKKKSYIVYHLEE